MKPARVLMLVVILLVGALVVAGCGGNDNKGAGDSQTSTLQSGSSGSDQSNDSGNQDQNTPSTNDLQDLEKAQEQAKKSLESLQARCREAAKRLSGDAKDRALNTCDSLPGQ